MERFRGPRWLAWTTGIGMTIILWLAGVTGYWLIWDERAQLITYGVRDMLGPWGASFMVMISQAYQTGESWFILFGILVIHVLLFVITAVFFILHIIRLAHAKWIPDLPWVAGMGVVLVLGSLFFPLTVLPPADFARLPSQVTFDPIFLFYLPTVGNDTAVFVLWSVHFVILTFFFLLPWIPGLQKNNPPKVRVIEEKCTGCTRCALDCPYKALEMIELPEGSAHKFLAVANPDMCVACGICLGSCLDDAITLGDTPPEIMWTMVKERLAFAQATAVDPTDIELVFACERYANQSARPYLDQHLRTDTAVVATHKNVEVIAVPCAGSIPPDLLTYALEEGSAEVRVLGCPPDDCAHRLGNLWSEQRLTRERPPRLRRKYANVPITAVWLPPDHFQEGLAADVNTEESNWLESRRIFETMTWKNFVPAFTMLALVMLVQILFSDITFPAAWASAPDEARVQIILADMRLPLSGAAGFLSDEVALRVVVNGELIDEQMVRTTAVGGQPFFAEYTLSGDRQHDIHVYYADPAQRTTYDIARRTITLSAGDIYQLQFDSGHGRCFGTKCAQ